MIPVRRGKVMRSDDIEAVGTGSIGGIGFIPSEALGRMMFGIFAVVIDFCAIAMWVALCRGCAPETLTPRSGP
jgi:hypothetical protein